MNEYLYENETYIDMDSTDEEVEAFIERERDGFRREWFEYVAEYADD